MLDTFIEGVGEVVLPCSVGLVLPGLAAVLLGWWRSTLAFVVFAAVAAVTAWARAADLIAIGNDWILAASLGGAVVVAWLVRRSLLGIAVPALLIGVFAGTTWRPCVGEQLASILNGAPDDPIGQLAPMIVYVGGVTLVLLGVALVPLVWPQLRIARPAVAPIVGSAVALVVLLMSLTGTYGDLLSEFAQLTVR